MKKVGIKSPKASPKSAPKQNFGGTSPSPTFSASGLSTILQELDQEKAPGVPTITMDMIAELMSTQGVRVLASSEASDVLQRVMNVAAEEAHRLVPAFIYRGDQTIETRELGCCLAMLAEVCSSPFQK